MRQPSLVLVGDIYAISRSLYFSSVSLSRYENGASDLWSDVSDGEHEVRLRQKTKLRTKNF